MILAFHCKNKEISHDFIEKLMHLNNELEFLKQLTNDYHKSKNSDMYDFTNDDHVLERNLFCTVLTPCCEKKTGIPLNEFQIKQDKKRTLLLDVELEQLHELQFSNIRKTPILRIFLRSSPKERLDHCSFDINHSIFTNYDLKHLSTKFINNLKLFRELLNHG